ncbi:hypothetical protein D9M71_765360 [compost metagenome]
MVRASGMLDISSRNGMCLVFLDISWRRMPHSVLRETDSGDGKSAHNWALIRSRVSAVKRSSRARKSRMRCSCSTLTKPRITGS